MAITMTDLAIDRIQELMKRSQSEDSYLRIGLKSGGCSGLSYIFDFVSEITKFDKVFEFGLIKVCILSLIPSPFPLTIPA